MQKQHSSKTEPNDSHNIIKENDIEIQLPFPEKQEEQDPKLLKFLTPDKNGSELEETTKAPKTSEKGFDLV